MTTNGGTKMINNSNVLGSCKEINVLHSRPSKADLVFSWSLKYVQIPVTLQGNNEVSGAEHIGGGWGFVCEPSSQVTEQYNLL